MMLELVLAVHPIQTSNDSITRSKIVYHPIEREDAGIENLCNVSVTCGMMVG
jgi:hypothetical protein